MASRKFSMSEYFNIKCANMQPLLAFNASSETEARQWRVKAHAKLRDLLGEMPQIIPQNPEIIETVDMGNYVREKVVFDADPDSAIPGYILIPKGLTGPTRSVLCLHGHGPGKDAVAGVVAPSNHWTQEAKQDIIRKYNYDYARQFAEKGYVAFTFDFRCFGERASAPFDLHGSNVCNVHFMRGSLLGMNLLALHIYDTSRAIDYLLGRPEVDHNRIGCIGLSFGGAMSMWAAAMDKRIKVVGISGYLCEYETYAVRKGNFCGSQYVPALRRYFDVCDIAAMIAPRPLIIESGIHDDGFPIESANRAYERLKKAYAAWGKHQCLSRDVFDGGHEFSGRLAFDWFDKWL